MARHDEREAVPLGSSLAAFFAIWRRCRRACPDVPEGLAQAEAAEGRGHQYWQLESRRPMQAERNDDKRPPSGSPPSYHKAAAPLTPRSSAHYRIVVRHDSDMSP